MKTYPYTDDGIIELVRKDEHDAVVAELEQEIAENTDLRQRLHDRSVELIKLRTDNAELLARLEERTQSHLHASSRDVQTIQRQSVELAKWQALVETLYQNMTAHLQALISPDGEHTWCNIKSTGDALDSTLAAYESAKKGEQP